MHMCAHIYTDALPMCICVYPWACVHKCACLCVNTERNTSKAATEILKAIVKRCFKWAEIN